MLSRRRGAADAGWPTTPCHFRAGAHRLPYTYDGADNLLTRVTPKGETISFAYDAVNQLLKKTLPGNLLTSYTYDTAGNLTGVTDPDSVLTMTYDLANRLSTVATTGSSTQPAVSLSYTYDPNGNRLSLTDPTGVNHYSYDALNRLATLTSPVGGATYAYDTLSRRSNVTLPNGTQTTYIYDPASQVTNILHKIASTSTQINKADYGYNNVGNRTSLTDRRGAQNFGYDPLDRLTSTTHPLTLDQTFAYDAVGNRTTNGSLHNSVNQLTEDAAFTYTYDDNGNLTRKTIKANSNYTQYTYDAENRLVKVEEFSFGNATPVATSTYKYDGLGRRIEKTGNGQTRRYVYDGEDILLEYDETNTILARYTLGPGIDEPIAMVRGGSTYFYHQDGLGSVTDLTDGSDVTAKAYAYDAWGNLIQQTGSVENPYTYTGREFDTETGLYYYRERYYDPRTGRFLQKDPIGIAGGTNTYPYVGGNPQGFIDPTGEIAVPLVVAGAVVGGVVNTTIYAATTQQFTWQGAAGSFIGGAIGGAIGTVATPLAAGAGLGTGFGGTAVTNAAAGVIGNVSSAAFDPCQNITPSYIASSAFYSAVGGAAAQKYFPTVGMQVFSQVGFPRTWSAFIPQWLGGSAGHNANALTQGAVVSGAFGAVGPNYVQTQAGASCPCQ